MSVLCGHHNKIPPYVHLLLTPVSLFQMRILRSREELQIRPSDNCVTCTTLSVCPQNTRTVSPEVTLKIRMVLSHDPVHTCVWSLSSTEYCTASAWPWSMRSQAPVSMFQIRALLSADPESKRPSPISLKQNTESV